VNTLIPNARNLSKHLRIFAEACNATEVILFERTTFLVIATSSHADSSDAFPSDPVALHALDPKRYERTSELIKAFKQSCSRLREEFRSLEMELSEFTAVLEEMTKNTYVLVVVHDPVIGESVVTTSSVNLIRFRAYRDGGHSNEHLHGAQEV
jgi:Ras-related GTP-binding protein A/B